jgi:hypothetical protein
MCNRKLSYVASLVLVMVLVGSASALNQWTNATGNGRWMDPNNWSMGVLPGAGTGNTQINPGFLADPNNLVGPTIGPGELAVTDAADVWGPEFGALTLNIAGGSYTSPAFVGLVSVGTSDDARPVTNLGADGSGGWLDVTNFLIGDSWWWHGGPYATFNQWSGTAIIRDYLWLGGKMNLFGGIMYVFNGVSMASAGQPADLTTLNIEGGILMLPANYTTNVESWIASGYCVAYGGAGQIVIEEVGGRTKVTAVPPAPAAP